MKTIKNLRKEQAFIICIGSHPGIIQSILDYDFMSGSKTPSIKYIFASNRKQERYFWGQGEVVIPVIHSPKDLPQKDKNSANALINFRSGRRVLESTREILAELENIGAYSIFAEQVPELHALELIRELKNTNVIVAGPASVGLLVPGVMKLGAIGGTKPTQIAEASIQVSGNTAVISTSGGMVNELINCVTSSGYGISFAMSVGGDRYPIMSLSETFLLAEADELTEQIVYFGELGGVDEYKVIELIRAKKIRKPIIAYIAGKVAELFEVPPQFGHAKALADTPDETANAKKKALKSAGVHVLDSLSELEKSLKKINKKRLVAEKSDTKAFQIRRKRLIVSRLSGDKNGEMQLLGQNLTDITQTLSYAELVLSILLGQKTKSKKLIQFTDEILKLLIDHGPYVAGATNTIMSARAGKDLVSSLATGILTIGPRFGGAINGAAQCWLEGVKLGQAPFDFVQSYTANGGIIPGIGHKKYRVDMPDTRVDIIAKYAPAKSPYTDFAKGVELVTTAKKGNLILNVDGAIAAVMLDLLWKELGYNDEQLQELVDIEFFNALFVISRSVGFTGHYLDQRRHDEGLLRLSDKEILYINEGEPPQQ